MAKENAKTKISLNDEKVKLSQYVNDRFTIASQARSASGIEEIWDDNIRAFEGRYKKEKSTDGEEGKSKIFVQITRSKCIAALASIVSAIFQEGKMPYEITESEIEDSINEYLNFIGISVRTGIKQMKAKINDQVEEAKTVRTIIGAILDMIVFGTCLTRSPVAKRVPRNRYVIETPPSVELPTIEVMKVLPPEDIEKAKQMVKAKVLNSGEFILEKTFDKIASVQHLRIQDAFPDPDMDDPDIQKADWFIHRAFLTKVDLLKMKEDEDLDSDAIMKCIRDEQNKRGTNESKATRGRTGHDFEERINSAADFEVLTFSGLVPMSVLREKLGKDDLKKVKDKNDDALIEALIISCGENIFEAVLNPRQDDMRPFSLCPYEIVPHQSWGRGIPQNIKDSQSLVNGLTRSFVEAKKLSSSLQAVANPRNFAPGTDMEIYSNKVWETASHVTDVRQAIQWFAPPDTTGGTLEAIREFRKLADDESGIPRQLEGSEAAGRDDTTAFEISKVIGAANLQLEMVIRNIDEFIIQRIIEGFYRWNMELERGEFRGDYQIIATGYQKFKNESAVSQRIDAIIGAYAQDPELRSYLRMEDLFRLRMKLIDMEKFVKTPEEIKSQQAADRQRALEAQQAAQQAIVNETNAKHQNAVLKKGEVAATKDAIQEERDIIEEQEQAKIAGTQEQLEDLTLEAEDAAVVRELDRIQGALDGR